MAAKTISIVRSDLSLSEVVRDLIKLACTWAEGASSDQDAQAMEIALRTRLESAVRHLVSAFFDYQKMKGGTESFPWEEDLRQAVEAILGVFQQRFFRINQLYPTHSPLFQLDDVLANLRLGLTEACQKWLVEESTEEQEVENEKVYV